MNEPPHPPIDPKHPDDDEPTHSIPPLPDDATQTTPSTPERIAERLREAQHPRHVGHYKILETLGEGGMGTVYLAEQTEPVHRKVALKLIKLGMDTKQVIARFESERQALAMMDHPHVAKMFDADASEQGRPYFVMEYVPGIPITNYCDKHRLTTKERLTLFMQVCQAIQHAHQKGIIHRDIKPNNVLVSVKDDQPVPKVIDFGIAKATQQKLTDKTLYTEMGQLVGTPAYMSPEQADLTALDIDTRSDIYSLGVMLYELLAGSMPFEPSALRQAAFGEIQRIIREEEPPKPSTRLSSLGDESGAVAGKRRTTRAALGKQLHGDLDWITMKALEKDRTRRYATATEFAADIQRHLCNEPVHASPPSVTYRLRKFVRRNRRGVIAAGLVFATLLAGMAGTIWQADKAMRERDRAVLAEQLQSRERERAETARDEANAVTTFLTDTLASVDPEKQGKDVSLREVLDLAAEKIGETFADKPLIEARLRNTIGWTYKNLGLYGKAESHLADAAAIYTREFGKQDRRTLSAASNLAGVIGDRGRFEASEAYLRSNVEIQRRVLGEEHPNTLSSMNNLANAIADQGKYAEAEALYRKTLEILRRVLGEEHLSTLGSINNLANALSDQGKYAEAEALHRKTLEIMRRVLGEEHPDTLASMNNLALALSGQDKDAEAEALHRKTLKIQRRVLGLEHPSTLSSMNNLALALSDQGKYAEAEALYHKTLEIQRRVLGGEHPGTLGSMNGLANNLSREGKYAKAEALHRKTLEIMRRVLGEEHPYTLLSLKKLVFAIEAQNHLDEARPFVEELLSHGRTLAEKPDANENDLNKYAWDLLTIEPVDLRDPKEALAYARKAIEKSGGKVPGILDTLALAQQMTGNIDAAVGTETKAVALLPPGPSVLRSDLESSLARYLVEQKSFAKAEPLLLARHQQLKDNAQSTAKAKQESIQRIIDLYTAWHTAEPGEGYDQKADEWRTQPASPKTPPSP